MIRELAQSGVTILLTTQYLEEADQLASRIAVIDHGRKIAEGSGRELKEATGSGFLHVHLADPGEIERAALMLEAALGHPPKRNTEGGGLSVVAGSPEGGQRRAAGAHCQRRRRQRLRDGQSEPR